jgi:hypothetical protein
LRGNPGASNKLTGPKNHVAIDARSGECSFFCLDVGDWSVLLGGFALAALVLFLNLPTYL